MHWTIFSDEAVKNSGSYIDTVAHGFVTDGIRAVSYLERRWIPGGYLSWNYSIDLLEMTEADRLFSRRIGKLRGRGFRSVASQHEAETEIETLNMVLAGSASMKAVRKAVFERRLIHCLASLDDLPTFEEIKTAHYAQVETWGAF